MIINQTLQHTFTMRRRPFFTTRGLPISGYRLEGSRTDFSNLSFIFFSAGSIPSDINFFTISRRLRASARVTVGKTPKANIFCLPPKRYCRRYYFDLFGFMRRCNPSPSVSFKGLSNGFTVLTLLSVSAIG